MPSFDAQRVVDTLDAWIVDRPARVVLAFLVVSGLFVVGLGGGGTDSGTDQFTEDVPAEQALQEVNDNFERITFGADSGSTQLIQEGTNVLAKPALLRMLEAQERLAGDPDLQVSSTSSVARAVARTLDPSADSIDDEIRAVERSSPSEIDRAVRTTVERNPGLRALLSEDYNARSASASATIGTVTHRLPGGGSDGPGTSGESPLTAIQLQAEYVVDAVGGDITVFGSGITSEELGNVINDSLGLVIPAAVALILLFLIVAYRDPLDLLLGLVALAMTMLWTFGFMGLAGIAFSQLLVAIPPLLLAVGIDFGIHAINRYREEHVDGVSVGNAMRVTTDQLLIAFFIVTGTTVLGFAANLSSGLSSIRELGVVAAVGIVFTALVFGIFLPATKVLADRWRERLGAPEFGSAALGSERSLLGRILPVGVYVARVAPKAFLVVVLVSTALLGQYGAGVDSRFTQEDFLPPEEPPAYLEYVPEPFRPGDYTVTQTTNFLERNFQTGEEDTTTVYVEGPLHRDDALESMWRAGADPPPSFVDDDGHARETSIVTVIRSYAAQDPEFAALVARNDRNDNGIPDDDLRTVYAALLDSPARDRALDYITDDYTSARIEYAVEADASQEAVTDDTRAVADRMRFEATATGGVIVLKAVSDVIGASAFRSLVIALVAAAGFLVFVYGVLEGRPSLGLVNVLPIALTVAALASTMRFLDIPFNVLTGTSLSIAIGLGIDYSAHLLHRFVEEYDGATDVDAALLATVRGTGGALTGSMLTTVSGLGVLWLAISPILGQFGLLIALSVLYSYLASILVLPTTLVLWDRYVASGAGRSLQSADAEAAPLD
ncbi:efflux RND transporter permease subunit [Haloplanus rubicundus]|uniref:RND transporter n=1 Tax=Haloplanus rubicundus TaxID=1547898 RepID=A0A345EDE4_9EURY|nr:MMPL family transporter [Haloplanus rubicundus]AXG10216.1 RND transporter [Haloplanus rubicundus]